MKAVRKMKKCWISTTSHFHFHPRPFRNKKQRDVASGTRPGLPVLTPATKGTQSLVGVIPGTGGEHGGRACTG
jgi:hypothetical protein